MSNLNYNKQHYLKLLKLKYSQEKILTSTEESELDEYWSTVDNTLDWETKEQYIDLLEKLICGKMDLCYSYSEVFESDLPAEKINSYALKFRNFMENIYLRIQKFLS